MGARRSFKKILELNPPWTVATTTDSQLATTTKAEFRTTTSEGVPIRGELSYTVRGFGPKDVLIRFYVGRELVTFQQYQVYFEVFQPLATKIIRTVEALARQRGIPTAVEQDASGDSDHHRKRAAEKAARKKYS